MIKFDIWTIAQVPTQQTQQLVNMMHNISFATNALRMHVK